MKLTPDPLAGTPIIAYDTSRAGFLASVAHLVAKPRDMALRYIGTPDDAPGLTLCISVRFLPAERSMFEVTIQEQGRKEQATVKVPTADAVVWLEKRCFSNNSKSGAASQQKPSLPSPLPGQMGQLGLF